MAKYKALLIQDISQFIELVKPYLDSALEAFVHETELEFDSALQWIIEEELEQVYSISTKNHDRFHHPHMAVRASVDDLSHASLSRIFAHHVGVPTLNNDYVVDVDVSGRNLYMHYEPLHVNPINNRTHFISRLHDLTPTTPSHSAFGPTANGGTTAPHVRCAF